jgi:hypothetical protein
MERVSDERLAELIAEQQRLRETWAKFDQDQLSRNPEYESLVNGKMDEYLSALQELSRLRELERKVEEMSRSDDTFSRRKAFGSATTISRSQSRGTPSTLLCRVSRIPFRYQKRKCLLQRRNPNAATPHEE